MLYPPSNTLSARQPHNAGTVLAMALLMMTFLLGVSVPLLSLAVLENARVNRQEAHLASRLRAEGAVAEGIEAIRTFYTNAAVNRINLWNTIGSGNPGYVVVAQTTSALMGGGTTYYAYINKQQVGGYEQFTNWVEAVGRKGNRTTRIRMPSTNLKLGDYSMWAHGSDATDSTDVNRGSYSGNITFTPGDYCLGHSYVSGTMTIQSGTPRATFYRRAEAAGAVSGAANGTFLMDGQPRAYVTPYRLDYTAGFWANAQARAQPAQGGIKLPGGFDYIIDLDQLSNAFRNGVTSITIKRRAHRADTSPSIEGDATRIAALSSNQHTSITQRPEWSATTEWTDAAWMQYWTDHTITIPTRAQWNGVLFAGDVNSSGAVTSNAGLASILLRGTAQFRSTSIVCTDDLWFIDNVYGGTTNGDFSRRVGNWNRGTGDPCTLAVCAKDEIEWSLVHPRITETMCGMFTQYGRFYSETKDYSDKLLRMPQRTEWDFNYNFQIDADSDLWRTALRERDAKNAREIGRGTRTVSLLGRSWTQDWFVQGPWYQRTGGPWVGSGGYDNSTYWHYPTYVGAGAYNTLSYDVDPSLANPLFQPPIMPVIMNGFQLGALMEYNPALDTWS